MPQCRSCGAEILWVKTTNGKDMPVDAKPERLMVAYANGYHLEDCYRSHFATCPNADQHRRKPKKKGAE